MKQNRYIGGQNEAKSIQGTLNRGPRTILVPESESKALKTLNPLFSQDSDKSIGLYSLLILLFCLL